MLRGPKNCIQITYIPRLVNGVSSIQVLELLEILSMNISSRSGSEVAKEMKRLS